MGEGFVQQKKPLVSERLDEKTQITLTYLRRRISNRPATPMMLKAIAEGSGTTAKPFCAIIVLSVVGGGLAVNR